MKNKRLVIFGNGLFAEVVNEYFSQDSDYEVAAFATEKVYLKDAKEFHGRPLVAFDDLEKTYPPSEFDLFVGVAYNKLNKTRAKFCEEGRKKGYRLASYVYSKVKIWNTSKIGQNCFVFEDNTIQPFAGLGDNVILWSGNHIGHHTQIGDHCFLTSHVVVSGNVTVGKYCFFGVNATIRDSIKIADECIIGAGALILGDTKPGEVYAGTRTPVSKKTSAEIDM